MLRAMRTAIASVAVAVLLGAPVAYADGAPQGFVANPMISTAGSFVAGKSVTDWCGTNVVAFEAAAQSATGADLGGWIDGWAQPNGDAAYLHPDVCSTLTRWNAGRRVDPDKLAEALLTVAHESEHLAGVTDESVADCKALASLPAMINRFFPLRRRVSMHVLMGDAWDVHDGAPQQYVTSCPIR